MIVEPEGIQPRNSDWVKDGVGITDDGCLVIRHPNTSASPHLTFTKGTLEWWVQQLALSNDLLLEVESQKRHINAREPHRFLKQAIQELEDRATEAAKLRGDGQAGKVMWGQAQGYRDAIALLKSYTQ